MLLAVEVVCATIGDSGCDGSDSCRSVVWILPYTKNWKVFLFLIIALHLLCTITTAHIPYTVVVVRIVVVEYMQYNIYTYIHS